MLIYEAPNLESGEVIKGGVKEISSRLNCTTGAVYNAASLRCLIHKTWEVDKIQCDDNDKTYCHEQEMLDEWDKVTEPFKKASRMLRRRMRETEREKKYRLAIQTLQAIAQRKAKRDEWDATYAFYDCRKAAKKCLENLGEPTTLH